MTYGEYLENKEKYTLLDVREDNELDQGMIPGAVHIPLKQLRTRLGELDKSKHYLAYCAVGIRGYITERILRANGFEVSNLIGGYRTYMDLTTNKCSKETNFSCS